MPTRDELINDALTHHEKPLLGYVRRLLGSEERARDVVQEAFLQLCRGNRSPAREKLGAWLYAVCRNKAFDFLRKEKPMLPLESQAAAERLADPAPAPLQAMEARERHGRLLAQISALPVNQREVVHLKFSEGMSYKQISEITGHSVTNVGFLIHTAVSTLRRELNGQEAKGGPR